MKPNTTDKTTEKSTDKVNKTMTAATSKTDTAADKSHDKSASVSGETILFLPLNQIHADYDWNIRNRADLESSSADGVQDETNPEGFGLGDLTANIHVVGQDTPVTVAAVKEGKTLNGSKTDKPYELIAGFRRFTAVSILNSAEKIAERLTAGDKGASVLGLPEGTIKAAVRTFANAREARILNARENTLRNSLKAPDLVRLVGELLATNGTKGMTQTEVGGTIGINQGYVSKLAQVSTLPKAVLNHYRDRATIPGVTTKNDWKQLSINQMVDLAAEAKGQTPGAIIERYVELLDGVEKEPKKTRDTSAAIEEKLGEFGTLIGSLVAEGILAPATLAWAAVMGPKKTGYLLDTGTKELTRERKAELADIINGKFARALEDAKKAKSGKVAE